MNGTQNSQLRPRVPLNEWAFRSGLGELEGLAWADATLTDEGPPFTLDNGQFRHVPYGVFLPPPMLQAAQEAQRARHATALEGILLLFARVEWLVATRHLLWTPTSPVPRLLVELVESYGVGQELHQFEPGRLLGLLTRLRDWYPWRGSPGRALRSFGDLVDAQPGEAEDLAPDDVVDEVFTCRGSAWWARRAGPATPAVIQGGLLRMVTVRGHEPSDVPTARSVPGGWLRLLPVWASIRLVAERSASDAPPRSSAEPEVANE